jgi:hypothetical protein
MTQWSRRATVCQSSIGPIRSDISVGATKEKASGPAGGHVANIAEPTRLTQLRHRHAMHVAAAKSV